MVRYVMTLIISVGGEHEMEDNNYSLSYTLKLGIKYIYGSLNQPMAQNILWRVTTLFIYHRIGEIWGLFRSKVRLL